MSDAQRDILKMLSDNVINVDEAERLLKALNEGEQRKEETYSQRRSHHGHTMGSMFESIGETLADIGPMIKNTVEDVMTGVFGDELGDLQEEDFVDIEPFEEQYILDQETRMVIVSDWKWGPRRGDLQIQGVAGNACRIENADAQQVHIRRSPTHFVIQWSGGPLKVNIPETVNKLRIRSKSGDIRASDVGCELNAKTLVGNLELQQIAKDFKAKTMGGDITLSLSGGWQGNGQIHTMGGDILLTVPDDVNFTAEASTMGGSISVDETMQKVNSKQVFPAKSTATVRAGQEETASAISLKTMGGDITLRKETNETDK
jgi:DUF4097 and DUF4098 domain-containing protein YvlB